VSAVTVLGVMVEYLLNTPRSLKMFKDKDFKNFPAMLAERDTCISALMNLKSFDLGGEEVVAKGFSMQFSALVDLIWVCSRHCVAYAYSWNVVDEGRELFEVFAFACILRPTNYSPCFCIEIIVYVSNHLSIGFQQLPGYTSQSILLLQLTLRTATGGLNCRIQSSPDVWTEPRAAT
jgi:hypothetical protein